MIKVIWDLLDFFLANDKTSQIEVVGALFIFCTFLLLVKNNKNMTQKLNTTTKTQ